MQAQFTKQNTMIAKGFAIFLLLMYHLFESETWVTANGVVYSPLSLKQLLTVSGFGNICVGVFVLLSAYGIAKGLFAKESDAKQAFAEAAKRFVKLMVSFAVLYFSVIIIWGRYFNLEGLYGEGKQGLLYLFTDATGLSMFFGTPTLNMTWWYMEIAYIIIFLTPILVWLVRKTGYASLLIGFFAPAVFSMNPDVEKYLLCAIAGVCAAYGSWFEKWMDNKLHLALKWLIAVVGFVVCVLIRQNHFVQQTYLHIVDPWIALFLIWMAGILMAKIPVVNTVLGFVGKHSMNIYMVHTFFYMILWKNEIYAFKYAGLVWLVLLAVSLIYSVVLELLKKIVVTIYTRIKK